MNPFRTISLPLVFACALAFAAGPEKIVPAPVEAVSGDGVYRLSKPLSGSVRTVIGGRRFARATSGLPEFAAGEAYRLTVNGRGISVEANTETGAFYAMRSLEQMLSGGDELDYCTIFDYPRFAYRGIMLDISRHFRDKEFIIKQIELLSEVKINRLHLHLTDDAGWRIEIERYPRLGGYAAWRIGEKWETWHADGKRYAEEGAPGATGGYLSKEDVREIVRYAESRHVTVVPEIELPGHSREIVAAYPELGCLTADGEAAPNTSDVCPGREETFEAFENILSEVMELFPSKYIHIGGDEAGKKNWHDCPLCRKRMEEEGLKDVNELQSYAVSRIERFLNARGRSLLGWDEILEGGLAPNATVMSWRGTSGGIKAAEQGHDVVMTPGNACYIDKRQDAPFLLDAGSSNYLPIDRMYAYDPLEGMPSGAESHVLGVQANLWQEYVPEASQTEYMLYPRAFAIAEIGWTPAEKKDLRSFRERAADFSDRARERGYNIFDLRNEYGDRKVSLVPSVHAGVGCPVSYAKKYISSYPAAGDGSLTDGLMGGWAYDDGRWQGFLSDFDVTVDLGSERPVHYVGATFIQQPGPDIYLPSKVEISVSLDGVNFEPAGEVWNEIPREDGSVLYVLFGTNVNATARYVRYYAKRTAAWLFTDEVVIN